MIGFYVLAMFVFAAVSAMARTNGDNIMDGLAFAAMLFCAAKVGFGIGKKI